MPNLDMILNGKEVSVEVEPGDILATVLRDRLGLIGTKVSCGEGECGSCTVLVDGRTVTSCIYPALKAQGREVTTIEGLGTASRLHPIQQAFVDVTAPQCGYCIPGMVLSAKALLDENPRPTRQEIRKGLSGNVCRCTGYYQIVEAIELAAQRMAGEGGAP
ncbi:MAG TPA: (2Fe-2S)-binding protein [Anaerolineae bacterium]|nr:(2Fe-2S)-binding protein [Anaerolineae bacterium]